MLLPVVLEVGAVNRDAEILIVEALNAPVTLTQVLLEETRVTEVAAMVAACVGPSRRPVLDADIDELINDTEMLLSEADDDGHTYSPPPRLAVSVELCTRIVS